MQTLQHVIGTQNVVFMGFSAEPRCQPISVKRHHNSDSHHSLHASINERSAPVTNYKHAAGDLVDAVLKSKLWRSHVDTLVVEQEEAGLAHEAGVPVEEDIRPVICGDILSQGRDGKSPWQRHKQKPRRDKETPMMMLTQKLLPEASPPKPGSSRRDRVAVAGSSSTFAFNDEEWSPGRRSMLGRDADDAGLSSPVVSVLRSSSPNSNKRSSTRRSVGSSCTPACSTQPKAAATLQDFQRLGPGLYLFKEDRVLEIWLSEGEPLVYEHEHISKPPTPDEEDDADVDELRNRLGIPDKHPQDALGMPLNQFLTAW